MNFGNFNKGDFNLVKEDKSEKPKIYAKLYSERDAFSASFFRLVEGNRKQKITDSMKLVGVPLNGKVVLRIKQLFCGGVKALTCIVQEVLVEEEIHPKRAFDDYEDEV